jgi:amino acid transporter
VIQQGQAGGAADANGGHGTGKRLGAFLCWAVVFADIGTSVYYVPGILYGQVGHLAGFFVALTLLVFLLLTIKYAEASVRFPEGGGEVTVASRGLNPWAGALGGMFILIDYFLTAAISSLSGLHYFSVVLPAVAPYVLFITVLVVVGLGVLNWWGIQESAKVSAVIATVAFASDLVIVLVVLVRVPLADILLAFHDIFSGGHLTGVTVLTGYAGAFLAFSGLESIAQLSPVMRIPRTKTVSAALGVVALTVGFSGPLLTIFSTVLLTDPRFQGTVTGSGFTGQPEPTQFISQLAGAYAGPVLALATAVAASALLIFASNTAIIGGYHVVLALGRLGYFPRVVRRTNALRGTPHVAIALVTFIPIGVLIAVNGNIDLLGELYGFGLLGAFSLMCLSMDVIRWRERRDTNLHIGATVDPELAPGNGAYGHSHPAYVRNTAQDGHDPGDGTRGVNRLLAPVSRYLSNAGEFVAERRGQLGKQVPSITKFGARVQAGIHPLSSALSARWEALWPNLKYYLGFLTTALVLVAWLTNLVGKPLATLFGGGLTILGLAVAVLHYRYQAVRYPVVFLDRPLRIPGVRLVVLTAAKRQSKAAIEAALVGGKEHPPTFLYLAAPSQLAPPRLFEVRDRFSLDEEAQATLSRAKRRCTEEGIQGRYLYSMGGAKQVFDIAAKVRPDELVAEAEVARRTTNTRAGSSEGGMALSPDYVRYRAVDGVRVAHYVLHKLYSDEPDERRVGR